MTGEICCPIVFCFVYCCPGRGRVACSPSGASIRKPRGIGFCGRGFHMLRWNDRPAPEVVRIGAFKLFPSQRLLMRDAEVVKLGSRSFDILLALADRPGETFTKNSFFATIWPDVLAKDISIPDHL